MILTVGKRRDHDNIFSFREIREISTFRLFLKKFWDAGKLAVCTIPIGIHFQCKLLFINGNVRHRGMDGNKNISYVHLSDI